jgi:hypothetical protein
MYSEKAPSNEKEKEVSLVMRLPQGVSVDAVQDRINEKIAGYKATFVNERQKMKEGDLAYDWRRKLEAFYKQEMLSRLLQEGSVNFTEAKEDFVKMQGESGISEFDETVFDNACLSVWQTINEFRKPK